MAKSKRKRKKVKKTKRTPARKTKSAKRKAALWPPKKPIPIWAVPHKTRAAKVITADYPHVAQVTEPGEETPINSSAYAFMALSEWGGRQKRSQILVTDEDGTFLTECVLPVRLTRSQVAIVESCCIPPSEYAKNMVIRERMDTKEILRARLHKERMDRSLEYLNHDAKPGTI